jgi:hypothetical protein
MRFAPGSKCISEELRDLLLRPGSGEPDLGEPGLGKPDLGKPGSYREAKIFHCEIPAENLPVAPKKHRTSSKTDLGTVVVPWKKRDPSNIGRRAGP